jgi:lipocalin-like protein
MNRRSILSLCAMTALGFILIPGSAFAQQKSLKEQLVGTWTYAASETVQPDGGRVKTWGDNESGLVIFGADGRYVSLVGRSGLPKFASNSRTAGSPEENKAVVQGSIATFGRYSINEGDRTLTLNIEYSTFPNWIRTEQKRPFTITGDELKYIVATASAGDGRGEVTLRRAK